MNFCSTLFVFAFAATIFLQCLNPTSAATTCHPDDEVGLLAFKSGITRDPSGILNSWKKGTACCTWNGITCLNGDRVTIISLVGFPKKPERSLSGTLSPLLDKLQHLQVISLGGHGNITGSFPQFLLHLPKLRYVNIENNRFSGPLPSDISMLSQLEDLSLQGNKFTGLIPNSISNLSRLLQNLNLCGNRLSGTIPDIFESMRELKFLDLSGNRLSGKLPPSIASLGPKLLLLDLSKKNLSGTIPEYISSLNKLEKLNLFKNRFSGVVPKGLVNLTNINNLDLSHNLLNDPFPALNFNTIEFLDLSYNQFHLETIPEWVTSLPSIFLLKLAKCGIKMSIENWEPAAPLYYHYIDLSKNEISGSLERFLNQTEYLLEFRAAGNKIRFDMGMLTFSKTLKTLDISRNLVFGMVPAMVASLQRLNLSQNHLCGKLPTTKFPGSAFAGNDCLCGSPLSPCLL
ncbi:LRR receptor-like serine/threonine-protein kinase FLS2 isoform X2 [Raphanus sativus]|uniref:LRR receptor-like serine/threonine-protein kinase FLS2 isoform X2 n=1 Tax=Raphanus sativus TaxID=3726 RepID=A0A9W3DTD0_RAPSA|nr:LRR receptor-like serine/threonine-protein kinase FLS2 isoform X2 [Raphanus sativus]